MDMQSNTEHEVKRTHHGNDNIMNDFTEYDLDEIQKAVQENHINWMNIANCIQHEMYPKLANVVRATIKDTKIDIGLYDLDKKHIDQMIEILKSKRNLAVEERMYLGKLCYRAAKFTPITNENRHESVHEIQDEDEVLFNSEKLKQALSLLQDIFDVHRHFIFSNYHFENYSLQQFREDIGSKYLHEDIVDKDKIKEKQSFHPSYIIDDDIFEVMNHIFCVSEYVSELKNEFRQYRNTTFDLKIIVIPKSVHSIYDEDIRYNYQIEQITDYLHKHNIYDYHRFTADMNSTQLHHQYDAQRIIKEKITKLFIIIDRRHIGCTKNIGYIFPTNGEDLDELNKNHFIGVDLKMIPTKNNNCVVRAYFRHGITGKLRFY
eukprot:539095_1